MAQLALAQSLHVAVIEVSSVQKPVAQSASQAPEHRHVLRASYAERAAPQSSLGVYVLIALAHSSHVTVPVQVEQVVLEQRPEQHSPPQHSEAVVQVVPF